MAASAARILVATGTCLLLLSACETSIQLNDLVASKTDAAQTVPPAPEPEVPGSISGPSDGSRSEAGPKRLPGKNRQDDLSLGKKYFNAAKFALAERHFRRAVELHPRDVESWIGLAACYDRLRRFDLADGAYEQTMKIAGPTPEILNNLGYSYMLRGDYSRARETLLQAQAQDPSNPYIVNNLEMLQASFREGKAIR
jgi:tetratricopeptide (TPR) repeat protein